MAKRAERGLEKYEHETGWKDRCETDHAAAVTAVMSFSDSLIGLFHLCFLMMLLMKMMMMLLMMMWSTAIDEKQSDRTRQRENGDNVSLPIMMMIIMMRLRVAQERTDSSSFWFAMMRLRCCWNGATASGTSMMTT